MKIKRIPSAIAKQSNSIFVAATIVIALLTLVFGIYEHQRERSFRVDILHYRLQLNNHEYAIGRGDSDIRVTVIDTLGHVLSDSESGDASRMENHLHRKEVKEALRTGEGFDIKRVSVTDGALHFYSATRLGDSIVRSSVPYSAELTASLRHDNIFFYYTAVLLVLLSIVVYFRLRYMHSEKEKQRIKRQLTENAAHELKTPAATIEGFLETLVANPTLPMPQQRAFIERCYHQSQRMSSLLSDMATLTRLDEAHMERPSTAIDLAEVLRNIEADTLPLFQERHILLRLHIPDTMPMKGDVWMMDSLFRNLFSNTLAYASGATFFDVSARASNGHFHLSLADNGIGVPEEHQSRIFERFYRVDKSRSRRLGGTGLGLAIAKNIALQYDGSMAAETTPGGGLTIKVELSEE